MLPGCVLNLLLAATRITYPIEGAVFPPDIAPPSVKWDGQGSNWAVQVGSVATNLTGNTWTPTETQWEKIKRENTGKQVRLTVLDGSGPLAATGTADRDWKVASTNGSSATVSFAISRDPVGAPLFYREVILPFTEAVKDPAKLRWRFGPVSALQPPLAVIENLPVCGNCHSFSRDGKILGMDVDYANDKGSYAIVPVEREMALVRERLITWSDYRRDDGELTFGLLAQVSPCGRYVVSTVKDRSIFMAKPDIAFSQLFFPIKGILAVYDRQTGQFAALPGADDKAFVQSNPTWSSDGQYIYFARAPAEDLTNLKHPESALVTEAEAAEFFARRPQYQFDICRVPFNGGTGGAAEPVAGASRNEASNFFPRISPDGNWLVFCKAKNYMLLQPDSELWIVPVPQAADVSRPKAAARRMNCNMGRMNSWHSWAPNGRWLVFAAKANGPYTQLWLTHVEENGTDAPPVVLDRLTAPDRAANIPEFVNATPEAIAKIRERFMDDMNYVRAGTDLFNAGDIKRAEELFRRAAQANATNDIAQFCLGNTLAMQGRFPEALAAFSRADELVSRDIYACRQGQVFSALNRLPEARQAFERALKINPQNTQARRELAKVIAALAGQRP